jgi:hypothetical protein
MLIASAAITLAAYSAGLRGNACRWRMAVFALILAALMLLILDFDIILRGFIRVNYASLASLIHDMEVALGR